MLSWDDGEQACLQSKLTPIKLTNHGDGTTLGPAGAQLIRKVLTQSAPLANRPIQVLLRTMEGEVGTDATFLINASRAESFFVIRRPGSGLRFFLVITTSNA